MTITPREAEICDLIVTGMTSKEVAQKLGISFRTVDALIIRIKLKYGAGNRIQLAYLIGKERA